VKRFILLSEQFPFRRSEGGLYVNNNNDQTNGIKIATPSFNGKLPNENDLIRLEITPAQMVALKKLDNKHFIRLKDKTEMNRAIRTTYFNKLVEFGCIQPEKFEREFKRRGLSENSCFTVSVMHMPFDFDGKTKMYKNFTRSQMFYHVKLDVVIEFLWVELFVYNAKMTFILSDVKGLEFAQFLTDLKFIESPRQQDDLLTKCILQRLHKRMTKNIGNTVSFKDFETNFDSYKTIYDMWRF